jgi:hypothetical protein
MKTIWITLMLGLYSFGAMADLESVKLPKGPLPSDKQESLVRSVKAIFQFSSTSYSPNVPSGSFSMGGAFDERSRVLDLKGISWIERPENYDMVPLKGKINAAGTSFTGRVAYEGCKEFVLKRTKKEDHNSYSGKWEGSYICGQGVTSLVLTVK